MPEVKRGQVYWVNFNPAQGTEQKGRRPAVVVQNDTGNANAPYTVVVAVSTAIPARPYPFMVRVAAGEANLPRDGVINCAQIRTVDIARLEQCLGSLAEERMTEVDSALRYELGLT